MGEGIQGAPQTIGIVGGGRGGHGLLKFFRQCDAARVAFVVDPNPQAAGIQMARQEKIPTFAGVTEALQKHPVDIVFDVTGVAAVSEQIARAINPASTRLVDSTVARLMVRVLDENNAQLRQDLTGSISAIKTEIGASLEGSVNLVGRINQMLSSMQMLALNASIEAAKVGAQGKGFAVVADHMTKSVDAVRKITQEIQAMNENIQTVAQEIDSVLEHLQ